MKVFRSFEESRKFVRKLDLKSQREWNQYVKSGKKPEDIPSFPPQTYHEEWKGWGDWLGTGTVANWNKEFATYDEAKRFVKKYKIQSASKWREFSKSSKRPSNVPAAPDRLFQKQGTWKGWGDFLGTGAISTQNKEYMSFAEARTSVHKLKLKNQLEWREFSKSSKRSKDLPTAPERVYKEDGWTSIADWLGKEDNTKKKKRAKK
jgi:hypothetical protein